MGRALSILRKARTTRCSKKDGKLLREAFLGNAAPGGQPESGLLVSQELKTPGKSSENKDVLLVRVEDIECLNFRFPTESLTKDESLLLLFILTCENPDCADLVCDHGRYKAVRKDCRKVLDESDMFMMSIEFPTPLNSPRRKCFGKSEIYTKIFTRKSSLKTLETISR